MIEKPISDIFGLPQIANRCPSFEISDTPPEEGRVAIDDSYVFRFDMVREMTAFWSAGETSCNLIGEKGAGKTSFVEQWHARMNLPLYTVSCDAHKEIADLIGEYLPDGQGGVSYQMGPVLRAMVEGASVLLDEYNTIPAKVSVGLNGVLEGRGIYVKELGQQILPQTGFRVFTTMNPEDTPGYQGRVKLDAANRERFWQLRVPYASAEVEQAAIVKALTDIGVEQDKAVEYADWLVKVASEVRSKYIANSDASDAIPEVISTRTLIRWARAWMIFRNQPAGIHQAMRSVLTNAATEPVRIAIHKIITLVTGFEDVMA
jgi:cobaltochelatase CobS